ncbi:MAG: DUF4835 family protein [Bacteroidia bacterium]|jgi:hypothetical protein|nr:DUF4835 family protein [Bacteroidales bacterium]NCD41561.1 DUF4835 family protein [Bacteroidia bacterium]MDD2322332.1 DUF4835 family protein [Bacteroidales bacterium]MDD3009882.1 DUF4835 family protein [Bacteroidales bacterium]MDD3961471.1 DUF4835 family protein [Bacteroidales bacterium]
MLKNLVAAIFFLLPFPLLAQEFKCTVSVSSSALEGTDRSVFQDMQKALYEFVNDKKWTSYDFKEEEKIECSIQITLTKRISSEQYQGKINIALRRPVFNTSYNSPVFNYQDSDLEFDYLESEPLIFTDNSFDSNLTAVIAFYLYMYLGMDFDTFQYRGGTAFYEKAQAVVNSAQGKNYPGWSSYESMKNRFWLVENMMNSSYVGIRDFLYKYHRKGLDAMADNIQLGRSFTTQALEDLRKASRQKPGLFALQLILDAKRDEIINIYTEGMPNEKSKIIQIMNEIDPANASRYQKIENTSL